MLAEYLSKNVENSMQATTEKALKTVEHSSCETVKSTSSVTKDPSSDILSRIDFLINENSTKLASKITDDSEQCETDEEIGGNSPEIGGKPAEIGGGKEEIGGEQQVDEFPADCSDSVARIEHLLRTNETSLTQSDVMLRKMQQMLTSRSKQTLSEKIRLLKRLNPICKSQNYHSCKCTMYTYSHVKLVHVYMYVPV